MGCGDTFYTPSFGLIALIDCNNFYASCRQVFEPKLKERKLYYSIIDNSGCVTICSNSNEAKALGIKMVGLALKRKDMFDKNNVSVFSSNFPLYSDFSARVMSVISQSVPMIENLFYR